MVRVSKAKKCKKEQGRKLQEYRKRSKQSVDMSCGPSTSADSNSPPLGVPDRDYFTNLEKEFQSDEGNTETKTTLKIREQLIAEVEGATGSSQKARPRPSDTSATGSRHSVVSDIKLSDIFSKYAMPCPDCMGRLFLEIRHKFGNSFVKVKCRVCTFVDTDLSPACLDNGPHFSEVSMNLVYESMEDGRGSPLDNKQP